MTMCMKCGGYFPPTPSNVREYGHDGVCFCRRNTVSDLKKFTVRIPEQFVDFEFAWYGTDSMVNKETMEALDERTWDEAFNALNTGSIELYDEHGSQVAIPSTEPVTPAKAGGADEG